MDANGSRFHLILREDEWGSCAVDEDGAHALSTVWAHPHPSDNSPSWGIDWSRARNEIRLHPRIFQFIPAPNDKKPQFEARRGAARDRYGNWYWIASDEREILVTSSGTGKTSRFWAAGWGSECAHAREAGEFGPIEPLPAPIPCDLRGLAITEDHFLVAGVLSPAGVLIFDLFAGGPPRQMLWPSTFAPFDMVAAPGGGLWVLDRDRSCIWGLDRHFNILNLQESWTMESDTRGSEFQPADKSERRAPERRVPNPASIAGLSPVVAEDPIGIECLSDGSLLVLDRKEGAAYSSILWYTVKTAVTGGLPAGGLVFMQEISLDCVLDYTGEDPGVLPGKKTEDFSLIAHDFVFIPKHTENAEMVPDSLYVAEQKGNQSFAFTLNCADGAIRLEPRPDFFPMRLFNGKALAAASGQAFYDFGDQWVPLIAQPRPRYAAEGTLYTPLDEGTLDGYEWDCEWHRLMLDASIPTGTRVQIWCRAANEKRNLTSAEWCSQPEPYQRGDGCELPFMTNAAGNRPTWETLFQHVKGRYLQIKLTLTGDGRTTPRIRALRAYYPRFSYLNRYLPAAYREDIKSASFLDRFLANFEGLFTSLEDRIAAVQVLFDARSCPPEAVEWLAGWFGIATDPSWNEARRRMFIVHAVDFFRHRGTMHGLRMALHLAFDSCVDESIFDEPRSESVETIRREPFRIVEWYRTRRTPAIVLGDTSGASGPQLAELTKHWRPQQGVDMLKQKYSEFMKQQGVSPAEFRPFPVSMPEKRDEAKTWTKFSVDTLGFVPEADVQQTQNWRDFLRRRHRTVSSLNNAHESDWKSFDEIPLPKELPRDGEPLTDWQQFQGIVLVMRRNAHRFRVLIPMPKTETPYSPEHIRRLELATRIINLEKPAHTVFDVKFYWSMFQVEAVRLGHDTILDDLSSRGAGLTTRMVMGQGHLGETYLSSDLPGTLRDRNVYGCGRLVQRTPHA